ncbi:hypothetical protein Bpfe_009507 [Biomphalaria pfeifferi]|uniref:Uncharacterized protein n=1 Tax=Biomphalaria pfeifferi TaxID=112525 RepID=A0AAD8FF79_BIOPF|nr:hypothetical protein Bpfe_009507 [Biomphalaria pfeifferi]
MSCFKLPKVPRKDIVDLKEVLHENVWELFRKSLSSSQRLFLNRDKYELYVPEKSFVFTNISTEFKPHERRGQSIRIGGLESDGDVSETRRDAPDVGDKASSGVSLETVFDNDTDEKQTYKFRFEKTRKTTVTVSCQESFTFGGKANFSIGLPKNINLGIESDMHFQVTETDGETFEEATLMEATSDILVSPHSRCTVSVLLDEKPIHQEFTAVTRMSLPGNGVSVFIRRKSDGVNVFGYKIKNLRVVFSPDVVKCCRPIKDGEGDPDLEMDFLSKGVIHGVIACNHKILLRSGDSSKLLVK